MRDRRHDCVGCGRHGRSRRGEDARRPPTSRRVDVDATGLVLRALPTELDGEHGPSATSRPGKSLQPLDGACPPRWSAAGDVVQLTLASGGHRRRGPRRREPGRDSSATSIQVVNPDSEATDRRAGDRTRRWSRCTMAGSRVARACAAIALAADGGRGVGGGEGPQGAAVSDNYDVLYARYLEAARQMQQMPVAAPSVNWMTNLGLDPRARNVNDLVTDPRDREHQRHRHRRFVARQEQQGGRGRRSPVRRRVEVPVVARPRERRRRRLRHRRSRAAARTQRSGTLTRDDHRAGRRGAAQRRPRARGGARDRHQRRPPDHRAHRRRAAVRRSAAPTSCSRRRSGSSASATSGAG